MTRAFSFVLVILITITLALSVPSMDADARGGNGNPPSHAKNDKGHGKPRSTSPPKFAHDGGRGNNPPVNSTPNPPPPANNPPKPNNPKPPVYNTPPKPAHDKKPARRDKNNSDRHHRQTSPRLAERILGPPEAVPAAKQKARADKKNKKPRQRLRKCVRIESDGWLNLPPVSLSGPEVASIGTLSLLTLMMIVLFGMWIGYYMGYKDSDKADAKFLRSLLGR